MDHSTLSLFSFFYSSLFFFSANARNTLPPAISPPPEPSPFKPGLVVVVGVLTTVFSITFLLLLYAKHCKRVSATRSGEYGYAYPLGGGARKNSGVERGVVESLPMFRFGCLMGEKDGLECAVCLTRFEANELLRLLPKCRHAFHVECVDTWLDAHSTCPLCRYRVDPEDVLLHRPDRIEPPAHEYRLKRVIGRHSSAGPTRRDEGPVDAASFRRSLDSLGQKKPLDRGGRKDGLLLSEGGADRSRYEHRIVVSRRNSASGAQAKQRWSDVEPLDVVCVRSEMMRHHMGINGSGRGVINERSVSEITGVKRFASTSSSCNRGVMVMSRWLDSQSRPHDVRTQTSTSGSGSGSGSGAVVG